VCSSKNFSYTVWSA